MGMSFFDALKVLKGTEVEAPRIIPPKHTPNHTPESYPMNSSVGNIPGFQDLDIHPASRGGAAHTASLFWIVTRTHTHTYIYICIYTLSFQDYTKFSL